MKKTITVTGYFLREPHPMAYETHPYEVGQTVLLYLQENTNDETDTDLILLSSTSKIIDDYMRPNNFYYKFVGFQYANILGEPIKFVLERIGQDNCYPYDVEIIDDHGKLVVGFGTESSCSQNEDPIFVSSKIEIGYNKDSPIIIEKPGNYTIKVNVDGISIEKEFAVRKNFSGVTLDRTFYPVLWADSPLKQFKSGVSIDDIQCKENLVLIQKHDGSPACVNPYSIHKLFEREWMNSSNISQFKEVFCALNDGKWSEEFHNCVGGSVQVPCDYAGASELTPSNVFGKIITQEGQCISHEKMCSSMGGTSECMSAEQKGHGRDVCIAVCEFGN